jgi:hypothetical protein
VVVVELQVELHTIVNHLSVLEMEVMVVEEVPLFQIILDLGTLDQRMVVEFQVMLDNQVLLIQVVVEDMVVKILQIMKVLADQVVKV